jgi:sugar lactone lactonase YvrE
MAYEVKKVGDVQCNLGEGLHWEAQRQCLWGVDIHGCKVWRLNLDSPSAKVWHLGQRVGWVLPLAGDLHRVLLGLQGGVALAQADTLALERWVHQPFVDTPSMRLNDAKADVTGAVWCGSLNNDNESQPVGCLYRLGGDGRWQTMDTGYTVANGPAIDASQKVLMHTDSGRRTIYRFDLDVEAGTLGNKRVWKVFTEAEGYPDGMCFDAEGALWVAHWGAGCISRFALDGALLARINLPASHITNVCFGGSLLDRLFVTSARAGLSPTQLEEQPSAGCVFEVIGHGVRGLQSSPASVSLADTV